MIGAGDFGQLVARHAPACGACHVVGFFDDTMDAGAETPGGTVLGPVAALDDATWEHRLDWLFVAVGYKHPDFRRTCFERLSERYTFATLVHETCNVDPGAEIGPGSMLLPGCTVDVGCKIGSNVLLNTGCVVAHDTSIDDHTFVGPAVALAGYVEIGQSCFLGINTTVVDNVRIAGGVQTGGGTVVTEDLTEPGLYVGAPARRVR